MVFAKVFMTKTNQVMPIGAYLVTENAQNAVVLWWLLTGSACGVLCLVAAGNHNVRVCRTGPLTCDFKTKPSRCRLEWLLREEFTDEHKITWLKNTGKYKPVAEKTPR